MKKIGYIQPNGAHALTVYYDEKRQMNPYGIYEEYCDIGAHGVIRRKRIVNKYADLVSCAHITLEYLRARDDRERAAVLTAYRGE